MSYKYELQVMDSRTVYPDGDKRVAVLPTAHQKSWDINDRLIKAKAITLTEDHDNIYHGNVIGQRNDGVNAWVTVEMDHIIPDDVAGVSPAFVPVERDENGLVKSFYYDHITLARKTEPMMPFNSEQIRIIQGTRENDDMTTKEELEAELKVSKAEAMKLSKKLEAMEAKVEEIQKANDETGKELKEKLKEEKARTTEYELREKKKLLAQVPDEHKLLFGEKEEDQLKASIKELERAVAMTKPKEVEPEEAAPDDAAGQPADTTGEPAGEPGKKMKLPPGVPPPEGAPDPEQAHLEHLRSIDLVARKKYGQLPEDTEGYDKIDTTKHSDFFAKYNINK